MKFKYFDACSLSRARRRGPESPAMLLAACPSGRPRTAGRPPRATAWKHKVPNDFAAFALTLYWIGNVLFASGPWRCAHLLPPSKRPAYHGPIILEPR